jgi:hypothetical protein
MLFRHFIRDRHGGVLVEVTVVMMIMLVFILGPTEFLFAHYQWSAATKAVQIGARVAAVSDPVAASPMMEPACDVIGRSAWGPPKITISNGDDVLPSAILRSPHHAPSGSRDDDEMAARML